MFNTDSTEDRALSPVIGVILLVGITVILVAVVGGLVTDFGSDVGVAPSAQVSTEFDTSNDQINLTHESGDDINPETIEFEYTLEDGTERGPEGFNSAAAGSVDGLFQAGDDVTLNTSGSLIQSSDVASGGEIRMIWVGENGDQNEVIVEEIVP